MHGSFIPYVVLVILMTTCYGRLNIYGHHKFGNFGKPVTEENEIDRDLTDESESGLNRIDDASINEDLIGGSSNDRELIESDQNNKDEFVVATHIGDISDDGEVSI
jgi:hypothetical protein